MQVSFFVFGISAMEAHECIFMCVIKFALDRLFVHIFRYRVVDIKQCNGILADTQVTDKLTDSASVNIYFAGYRNTSYLLDGCSHSKEQIRTVSGMQASIFRRSLHICDSLCAPLPSQVSVSSYCASFGRISGFLLPSPSSSSISFTTWPEFLDHRACFLKASNRSSSEFSSISTPRL